MLDRLGQADRVYGVSAAITLVAAFLPWYRFESGSTRITANAFGAGFCGDMAFFAAAGGVLLLLVRHGAIAVRNVRADAGTMLALGAVALGSVTLQLLIGVNGSGAFHFITVGIVVALLGSAGMIVGAWTLRHEEHDVRGAHPYR